MSSEKCIKSGDTTYYVGDIVIQIKNNYEAEVDMGDMNIENASQNDEPSIKNTFIPNTCKRFLDSDGNVSTRLFKIMCNDENHHILYIPEEL